MYQIPPSWYGTLPFSSMYLNFSLLFLATMPRDVFAVDDKNEEFSNNLVSDLAPFLALFGERVAQQFMSQSMGWADIILFAMAPLGVVAALVGAIRVGGPTGLKTVIGRAREARSMAEQELMSSTSPDVCEMWNGRAIVRLTDSPPIKQFIHLCESTEPGEIVLYTLEEARRKRKLVEGELPLWRPLRSILRRRPRLTPESEEKGVTTKDNVTLPTPGQECAPNISLNFGGYGNRHEVWAAASVGIILQSGVLIYDAFATYQLRYMKGDSKVSKYAFPMTAIGTVAIVIGMLICSYVIDQSTEEKIWTVPESNRPNPGDDVETGGNKAPKSTNDKAQQLRLMWLQKGQVVNDQVFESFVIFANEPREWVMTSRPQAMDVNTNSASNGNSPSTSHGGDSIFSNSSEDPPSMLETWVVIATIVTVIGFITQILGLRAMHWSATGCQFIATLIMTALRSWVRRSMAERPHAWRVPTGFELEWLAMRLSANSVDSEKEPLLWMEIEREIEREKAVTEGTRSWRDWGRREKPQKSTTNERMRYLALRKEDSMGWEIIRSTNGMDGGELPDHSTNATERPQLRTGAPLDTSMALNPHNVLRIRSSIGSLTRWPGPSPRMVTALTLAIEGVMNALFTRERANEFSKLPGEQNRKYIWDLVVRSGKSLGYGGTRAIIQLKVQQNQWSGRWTASESDLEALLSLWLFDLHQKEEESKTTTYLSRVIDNDALDGLPVAGWRRRRLRQQMNRSEHKIDVQRTTSLIHMAPKTMRMSRDAWWWLGVDISQVLEVQSVSNFARKDPGLHNNTNILAFHEHRIMGGEEGSHTSGAQIYETREVQEVSLEGVEEHNNHFPSLAYMSEKPLEVICAQEIFCVFMQNIARTVDEIEGQTAVKETPAPVKDRGATPSSQGWKFIRLENSVIQSMVNAASGAGLCSKREAHLLVIPALSMEKKLPKITVLTDWAQEEGKACERRGQWQEAGDIYLWLFCQCNTRDPKDLIAIRGTAILLEFFSLTKFTENLWQKQFRTGRQLERLKKLSRRLLDALLQANKMVLEVLIELRIRRSEYKGEDWWGMMRQLQRGKRTETETTLGNKVDQPPQGGIQTLVDLSLESRWDVDEEVSLLRQLRTIITRGQDMPNAELGIGSDIGSARSGKSISSQGDNDSDNKTLPGTHWPLHNDLVKGDSPAIQRNLSRLLPKAVGIPLVDIFEWTPLHYPFISRNGNQPSPPSFVRSLIEKKGSVDTQDMAGQTALHHAARRGLDIFGAMLLQAGADSDARDRFGMTPIHWGAAMGHEGVVKMLWEGGAILSMQDYGRRTALHWAAYSGNAALCTMLVGKGLSPSTKDDYGRIPLHFAISRYQLAVPNIVRLFDTLDGHWLGNVADRDGLNALHLAGAVGNETVISFYMGGLEEREHLHTGDIRGRTALHLAAAHGNLTVVMAMLHGLVRPAKVGSQEKETQDTGGIPPENYKVTVDAEEGRMLLLKKCYAGRTALHYAVRSGNMDIVQILIEAGTSLGNLADMLKTTDEDHWTALHTGVWIGVESAMVKLLLGEGTSDIYHRWAALELARQKGDRKLVDTLTEGGEEITVVLRLFDLLFCSPLNQLEHYLRHDWTKYSIDLNIPVGVKGMTLQDIVVQATFSRAAESGGERVVQHLFNALRGNPGFDINKPTSSGHSTLFQAAALGLPSVIKTLLKLGADKDWCDRYGRVAIDVARDRASREALLESQDPIVLDTQCQHLTSKGYWQANWDILGLICNGCNSDIEGFFYHCCLCCGDDYDLCAECYDNKSRCFEGNDHKMRIRFLADGVESWEEYSTWVASRTPRNSAKGGEPVVGGDPDASIEAQ